MQTNNFYSDNDKNPLCRFGPGGEFVSDWPINESDLLTENKNPLGRVLNSIANMIGATIIPDFITVIAPTTATHLLTNQNRRIKEKTQSDSDKIFKTDHAKTIADTKLAGSIPDQPTLFGDNSGTGTRTWNKQNYRIRTYRRAARKKPPLSRDWQGTLFETHKKRAKSA